MASQPIKRQVIETLAALADDDSNLPTEDKAFSYLCAYMANGGRLSRLAKDLDCSRFLLDRWVKGSPERAEQFSRARALGADALVDEGGDLLDAATRDTIAVANARAGWRKWLAGKYDPETWGEKQASGPVVYGDLHLHALQRPQALPSPSPVFPLPRSFPEAPPAQGTDMVGGGEVPITAPDTLLPEVGTHPVARGTPPSTSPVGECLSKNSTVSGESNG